MVSENNDQSNTVLLFLDKVYHASDFNVPSAAVYFDFSKAFDSVRHDIILNKLSLYGFDHDFLVLFFVLYLQPILVYSYKRAYFQSTSCN